MPRNNAEINTYYRNCPDSCPDGRRKQMVALDGTAVEMCYTHIAMLSVTTPVKPIFVRVAGYYDSF